MPAEDLVDAPAIFFRFHAESETLGFAGLEGQGRDLLLRSMWVAPAERNRGMGACVLGQVERLAHDRGCDRLHLLTTTAERFFRRHGYVPLAREQAPAGIAESREFQSLCPASAVYMSKTLRHLA
ncbi:arsenic resistance N-acetyltransferase ArsN2 [Dokdonella sp.]|uniref:arsenic resistance N-acetyltransferase ArsN2 n=1 Tax=Dokdonella sp. TaxID=2291710 RepID=UPI0035289613